MTRPTHEKGSGSAARSRPLRSDGQVTREQLLNTAGLVFAESGYERTTSKAICERARTNLAAVNYHFGSKDGLYEAVLAEAHRQLLDADDLTTWAKGPGHARARLERVLGEILAMAAKRQGWAYPVLLRELLSPSPLMPAWALKTVRPKAEVVVGLMAEVTGLPMDHPSLQRCVFMCLVPCMVTAIAPPSMKTTVLPSVATDTDAFAADVVSFAMAGIDAVAARAKGEKRGHKPVQKPVQKPVPKPVPKPGRGAARG